MRREIKFTILALFILILILSCKEQQAEINEYSEDIVYSDSFSPLDWEHPVARRVVVNRDKDIGLFINENMADPNLRKISTLVKEFFTFFNSEELDRIAALFTDSSYNSFKLRVDTTTLTEGYSLRVEQPSSETIATGQFWVRFKLLSGNESLVGGFELVLVDDEYKISDFETTFFEKLQAK